MSYVIRDYSVHDAGVVNSIALAAFEEYRPAYADWPAFAKIIGNMEALAASGEIIVAASREQTVGAVVYVGPGKAKAPFFDPEWPIIRMLVVHPAARGQGIGHALTVESIQRAVRDGSACIALHTTPIMRVALPMYQRLGFEWHREAPPIFGVPYGIYVKRLGA